MECGEGGIGSRTEREGGSGSEGFDPAAASRDGGTFERYDAGDCFLCVEARRRKSAAAFVAVHTNQCDRGADEPAFSGDVSEDGGQYGFGVERKSDGAREQV